MGITRYESMQWQREAIPSDEDFHRYVESSNGQRREVSTAGFLRFAYSLSRIAKPRARSARRDVKPVLSSTSQSDGSSEPKEIIAEFESHHQLLTSLLIPVCQNKSAKLKPAECKHVKYLLSQIEAALKRLRELM